MKVQTQNKTYDVRFYREHVALGKDGWKTVSRNEANNKGRKTSIRSHCFVSEVVNPDAVGSDKYQRIAHDFATRVSWDQPNRAEGFRHALMNTLEHIEGLNKEERSRFWTEFLNNWGHKLNVEA